MENDDGEYRIATGITQRQACAGCARSGDGAPGARPPAPGDGIRVRARSAVRRAAGRPDRPSRGPAVGPGADAAADVRGRRRPRAADAADVAEHAGPGSRSGLAPQQLERRDPARLRRRRRRTRSGSGRSSTTCSPPPTRGAPRTTNRSISPGSRRTSRTAPEPMPSRPASGCGGMPTSGSLLVARLGRARSGGPTIALVDNAIDHTPRDGEVRIAVRRHRRDVILAVSDTGPGIGPEAAQRVLRRFDSGGHRAGPGALRPRPGAHPRRREPAWWSAPAGSERGRRDVRAGPARDRGVRSKEGLRIRGHRRSMTNRGAAPGDEPASHRASPAAVAPYAGLVARRHRRPVLGQRAGGGRPLAVRARRPAARGRAGRPAHVPRPIVRLVAADLLLVQVFLMARVPMIERSYGQDELARRHRLVGFWSFNLLMVHVALILGGYTLRDHNDLLHETWSVVTTYGGMLLAVAAKYRADGRRRHLGPGRSPGLALRVVAPAAPVRVCRGRPVRAARDLDRRGLHDLAGGAGVLVVRVRRRTRRDPGLPRGLAGLADASARAHGPRGHPRGSRRGDGAAGRSGTASDAGPGRSVLRLPLPRRPGMVARQSVLAVGLARARPPAGDRQGGR